MEISRAYAVVKPTARAAPITRTAPMPRGVDTEASVGIYFKEDFKQATGNNTHLVEQELFPSLSRILKTFSTLHLKNA